MEKWVNQNNPSPAVYEQDKPRAGKEERKEEQEGLEGVDQSCQCFHQNLLFWDLNLTFITQ